MSKYETITEHDSLTVEQKLHLSNVNGNIRDLDRAKTDLSRLVEDIPEDVGDGLYDPIRIQRILDGANADIARTLHTLTDLGEGESEQVVSLREETDALRHQVNDLIKQNS